MGATGNPQSFTVGQATPTTPTISNLPMSATYGGGFPANVSTTGDGTTSVDASTTPTVCTVSGSPPLDVSFIGVGTCTLTAKVAAGTDYMGATGNPQSFTVGQATPTTPTISNLPMSATYGGGFPANVSTTGDGATSVDASTTPTVCTVSGSPPLDVSFIGVGTCTLTAKVAAGTDYMGATGNPQSFTVDPATPTTSACR